MLKVRRNIQNSYIPSCTKPKKTLMKNLRSAIFEKNKLLKIKVKVHLFFFNCSAKTCRKRNNQDKYAQQKTPA